MATTSVRLCVPGRPAVETALDDTANHDVVTGTPSRGWPADRTRRPGTVAVPSSVDGRHLQRQQTTTGRQLSKHRIARQATLQKDDVHVGRPPTRRRSAPWMNCSGEAVAENVAAGCDTSCSSGWRTRPNGRGHGADRRRLRTAGSTSAIMPKSRRALMMSPDRSCRSPSTYHWRRW